MSYATSYVFIASASGLTSTLRAQYFDADSANVGSALTTGFSYIGAGEGSSYFYQYAATIPDSHAGGIKIYDTGAPSTILMVAAINPRELENADAKTSNVLATSVMQSLADVILGRSVATVEDTASTHSLAEIILGILKSSAPSTTWTIKKTDGTTTFNTRTLTLDEDAPPVTGVA
jgi:hypothetical protein